MLNQRKMFLEEIYLVCRKFGRHAQKKGKKIFNDLEKKPGFDKVPPDLLKELARLCILNEMNNALAAAAETLDNDIKENKNEISDMLGG